MNSNKQMQQSLLELHYGLLDDTETNKLRALIESDAQVASLWAKTLAMAGQFADAASLAGVPANQEMEERLRPPTGTNVSLADRGLNIVDSIVDAEVSPNNGQVFPPIKMTSVPADKKSVQRNRESRSRKEAETNRFQRRIRSHRHWMLAIAGLAACFLAIIFGRFLNGIPVSPAMMLRIQAESAGGDELVRNQFDIFTSHLASSTIGATEVIRGVSATLSVAIKVGDVVLHTSTLKTDASGRGLFIVPTELKLPSNATLHIDSQRVESDLVIPLEPTRCLTYLTADKPIYRPGDIIRFRSLTLERYSLRGEIDLPIRFEMLDPSGAVVNGATLDGVTYRGVGNGQFLIPESAPGGQYTLVVKSLDGFFPPEKQKINVRNYRVPRFKKDLEFKRRSYGPGEMVHADFEAIRAEGGPADLKPVKITAKVDGEVVFEGSSKTDASGTCAISFRLPEHIARGNGQLSVAIDDGGTQEVQSKTIPIQLGRVDVVFYPEGGYLVNGFSNRVYFSARNPQGEPIHVAGEIQDRSGKCVAKLATVRDGMGQFEFTPRSGDKYSLKVIAPVDVTNSPELPTAVENLPVISTGSGVFANHQNVTFVVRTKQQRNVIVQAVCRGKLVADQPLKLTPGNSTIEIELPAGVEGVIRLTVLNADTTPAQPLVERLIYRECKRKLTVKVDEPPSALERTPGEPVRLSLSVFDENGQPTPAVLGIAVVDEAALSLEEDERPELRTHFVLTSEIEKPEDLEHANFYLSGSDESQESLDLLLGTQGWRRFVNAGQALTRGGPNGSSVTGFSEQIAKLIELDGKSDKSFTMANVQASNKHWHSYSLAVSANWSRFMFDLTWLVLPFVLFLFLLFILRPKFRLSSVVGMWLLMACGYALVLGCGASQGPAVAPEADMAPMDDGENENQNQPLPPPPPLPPIPPRIDASNDPGDMFDDDPMNVGKDNLAKFVRIVDHDSDGRGGIGDVEKGNVPFGNKKGDSRDGESNFGDKEFAQAEISASVLEKLLIARGLDPTALGEQLMAELRFPVREYSHQHVSTSSRIRSDFAETLYWQPLLITDSQGKASIRFDLSDSVTTFRVMADAHSEGRIGSGGGEVVSRLPFQIEPKMPLAVTTGDRIDLPVAVINATDAELPVDLTINPDSAFKLVTPSNLNWLLNQRQRTRGHFGLEVVSGQNETDAVIELTGIAGNGSLTDSIRRKIHVSPMGYPIRETVSGVLNEKVSVLLPIPDDAIPGSVEVTLKAYPSPLADLLAGVESILREPHGCFEQTSATNYPNTMALQYLQENRLANPEMTRRAKSLLDKGYQKLVSFECKQKGYEWFGSDPGHEALSAFGLLQFTDMATVMKVDVAMMVRTRKWLMDRRDGKGSFKRNPRHLHVWSVDQQIVDAYVLWALTEADVASGNPQRAATELTRELNQLNDAAKESSDPYLISLAAASMVNVSRNNDGKILLDKLVELQKETGELVGVTTVTQSGGVSRTVETTALAVLAWTKTTREYVPQVQKAAQWLVKNRQGHGGFGSTQATVLALKALVAYSRTASAVSSGGTLLVKNKNEIIGQASLPADAKNGTTIEITGLGSKLAGGANDLELVAKGTKHLPFSVEVLYHTATPPSDDRCPLELTTKFESIRGKDGRVDSGATLQVKVVMTNKTANGQPMTVATIGLPGGVEPRVEQLDELRDAGMFDYYEIRPREITCYWRTIAPDEKKEFTFDVTAEIPGKYTGPASRVYLYYTAEQKFWTEPLAIEIAK